MSFAAAGIPACKDGLEDFTECYKVGRKYGELILGQAICKSAGEG